jgi:hypothetical protein
MISKVCRVCAEDKPLSLILPRYDRKGQYSNICRECHNLSTKKYYHENSKTRGTYNKSWREVNKDHVKAKSKSYYASNKEQINLYTKVWRQYNQDRVRNYSASRRALKKQAFPKWLTTDQLKEIEYFYIHARDCEIISGQKYHVDHIVPLKGENVCGLHVPWNLQLLPSDINLSKHNKYDDW